MATRERVQLRPALEEVTAACVCWLPAMARGLQRHLLARLTQVARPGPGHPRKSHQLACLPWAGRHCSPTSAPPGTGSSVTPPGSRSPTRGPWRVTWCPLAPFWEGPSEARVPSSCHPALRGGADAHSAPGSNAAEAAPCRAPRWASPPTCLGLGSLLRNGRLGSVCTQSCTHMQPTCASVYTCAPMYAHTPKSSKLQTK